MKWYTCCNDEGLKSYGECLLAACRSCLANTSLAPCLIYDGAPNAFTDHLASLGVTVLYRTLSFADRLAAEDMAAGYDPRWASAVFLRFDIPLIEQEDDFVLYADADVLFCAEVEAPGPSAALYAANEIILEPPPFVETPFVFNAGVMVLNVPFFREIHPVLVALALDLARGTLQVPWYDQGILNQLLGEARALLPPSYNTRPYFPTDADPVILHFQCLRPAQIAADLAGGTESEAFHLYKQNRLSYERAIALYKQHLSREGLAALRQACPDALVSV